MTMEIMVKLGSYLVILTVLAFPLGIYIAKIYQNQPTFLMPLMRPAENLLYRLCRADPSKEHNWRDYLFLVLIFNGIGFIFLFLMQLMQGFLFLNPMNFKGVGWALAFNTAASFVTNTNWQSYSGEKVMSYLTQMAGMSVQNFLSAATGMSVFAAVARGFAAREGSSLGNFFQDMIRSILYILLPLAFITAALLVSEGVVQNFLPYHKAESYVADKNSAVYEIPAGPAASQIAIKQLGTNGGGFFGTNSAHPFENPTPFSNWLEMLLILLVAASLPFAFGKMIGKPPEGKAIFMAMFIIFLLSCIGTLYFEHKGNPLFAQYGVQAGSPNLEGKETRIGVTDSAIWATATTAASNGSVNAMMESFTPMGAFFPLLLMQLGEVVFGGVGSGMYGMLVFVLLAVFIAGLMVGRTPEYLGKKVEAFEMKMSLLVILTPTIVLLAGTAIAVIYPPALASFKEVGPHGFSEALYAFSSASNNNGSAFAGLSTDTNFYNIALGLAMIAGRFIPIAAVLALAGSVARKKILPESSGTLKTKTPLFICWLICIIVMIGALSFLPALTLGPVVEHILMLM